MCEMFCAPNLLGYPSLQSSEPEDELRHLPANCKSPKRLSTFPNPRRMNFFFSTSHKAAPNPTSLMKKTEPNSSFDNLSVCLYSYSTIAMQPKIKSRHTKKKHKKKSWGLQNPKKPWPFPTQEAWQKLKQHQIEQPQLNPHPGPW